MMKWNSKHRDNVSNSSEESDDISRSIEALDKVLDEFDDITPKRVKGVKKKTDDFPSCDGPSPKSSLRSIPSVDPVRQSLDILDTVLAQYEDEINHDTKDNALAKFLDESFEESTEIDSLQESNDAEPSESHGSDDNLASPTSKVGKKVSPPPVPKRSPTTCLSCSSSFECPSPETEFPSLSDKERSQFFSDVSATHQCDSEKCVRNSSKNRSRKLKLSSHPVKKGTSRPNVKANDSATSQDDLSDEDEVFHNCSSDLNPASSCDDLVDQTNNNNMLQIAKFTTKESICADGDKPLKTEMLNAAFDLKEKFALAKFLLKTGQLQGIDEEPPAFKPPPIPLPPKMKNKGKAVSNMDLSIEKENRKASARKDTNGNEVSKSVTATESLNVVRKKEFLVNSESVQNEAYSNQQHVTSVKITQPLNFHSNNVSVISIQPKTPPASAKDVSNVPPTVSLTKPTPPPKDSQQPRVALSTFTRTSTNNNNSKSSSLEDVCSSNNVRTQNAVVAADNLGMTKTGSLPLELKKPNVSTGGAVFFNVFQCPEGEKSSETVVDDKKKAPEKKEADKKQGWKKKKSKKEKSAKESPNVSTESIKATTEQNALLAELTGKIQTKKTATPNCSSSDESDQGSSQTGDSLEKNPKNDDKDKGIWKGFWKKKQVQDS